MDSGEFREDWEARYAQANQAFWNLHAQFTELTRISGVPVGSLEGKELRVTAIAKSEALIPPTCPTVNRLFRALPATPTTAELDVLRMMIKSEATVPLREALTDACERELILQQRIQALEALLPHLEWSRKDE